jgi:hypothetical protein
MRSLLMLFAVTLLGFGASACGSSSRDATPASRPTSDISTGAGTVTTASASKTGRPPEDDNHIATYGHEATEPDKREITALVKRYYEAAVADDGARACSLIYSPLAKSIPEDYGQVPGPHAIRHKTCAVVLSKIFKQLSGQTTADLGETRVTGVRLKGSQGFVQLSSKAVPTGRIFVEREHGSWKIGGLIGETCKDCAAG